MTQRELDARVASIQYTETTDLNLPAIEVAGDAFEAGVEWADGHPRWISIEDELPRCGLESRLQDYWQDVRERAAIAAMQGILCTPIVEGIDPNPSKEHIAELAVAQADALIEELKKK